MQTNGKKFLCAILSIILLIGLCACKKGSDNPGGSNPGDYEGALPEVIFDRWYPHPEVSEDSIEISADGTCNIGELTSTWEVESITEDKVVLIAGSHYLTFTQLSSSLPILTETSCGDAVKEPELWNYITEWYNEQTGVSFALVLEELAQIEGNIQLTETQLLIEALDGETVTHTVTFTPSCAVVVDAEGNSTIYYPMNGSSSGKDPEAQYIRAMNNLQRVLAVGNTTTYADSNGEYKISDSEALEKLYKTFVSLQKYMDVSEQLNCIRKVDNVLVSLDRIVDGVLTPVMDYEYNSFGSRSAWWEVEEAVSSGTQIYHYCNGSGNIVSIEIWGLVKGTPVYDGNGNLTALTVTSDTTRDKHTASVTCDASGNVVRIEVPFVEDPVDGIHPGETQVYDFLYDANGRLVQYMVTRHSTGGTYETTDFYKEYGFHYRTVTECYYDNTGKLTDTVEHHFSVNQFNIDNWYYSPTQYLYNADGLLTARIISMGFVKKSGLSRDEIERLDAIQYSLFHPHGFVDSVGNQLVEQIGRALSDVQETTRFQYEYGSIYVYQPEESYTF